MKRGVRELMAVCAGAMLWGSAARAEGVTWSDLTLAQALAKADDLATLVMIDVYASHCMQCKDMDREVWETSEGAELAEGLIMLRIPSDKPEGRALQDNYPVLGLPLVILLEADGTESGRIVGYRTPEPFLEEARALKAGFDPLPEMEAELEAQPTSQKLTLEVLEQYLYRQREAEAESLLAHLLELDSRRISTYATKALGLTARYYDYFKHDSEKSQKYWRIMLHDYAQSRAVNGALKATYEYHRQKRTLTQWIEMVCAVADANPEASTLNAGIARWAVRGNLTHPCLAAAARRAHALGAKPAIFDSLAIVLEGTPD